MCLFTTCDVGANDTNFAVDVYSYMSLRRPGRALIPAVSLQRPLFLKMSSILSSLLSIQKLVIARKKCTN